MPADVPVIERPGPGNDRPWLALALGLTFVLRVAMLLNTEVTAPDSVGFIRYALELESKPWTEVVRAHQQHPGYPYLVMWMSKPVRAIVGETTPEAMRWSAQLVSLVASLLLVFPTYRLGSILGHRAFGFAGAVLFQFLPVPAHNLSDGITDATYLLFLASGLWTLIVALECNCWKRFAIAGVFAGLAYLTRPEGAEVLALGVIMIAVVQVRRAWRLPWGTAVSNVVALSVAALAVGSPYFLAIGGFSNKPSTLVLEAASLPGNGPLGVSVGGLWAVNIPPSAQGVGLFGRAVFAIISEIDKNLFHHGWFGLIFGIYWLGRAYLRSRAGLAILLFLAMHTCALLVLGIKQRYVADRHVMPIVMLISPLCVAGMAYFLARIRFRAGRAESVDPRGYGALRLTFIVMGLLVLFGIPKAVQSLHGGRLPNRMAGEWLAEKIQPGDDIVDSHGIASLYAKVLATHRGAKDPRFHLEVPQEVKHPTWVVVTRDRDGWIYDIKPAQERDLIEKKHAVLEYHYPDNRPESEAKVVIYRIDPQK